MFGTIRLVLGFKIVFYTLPGTKSHLYNFKDKGDTERRTPLPGLAQNQKARGIMYGIKRPMKLAT